MAVLRCALHIHYSEAIWDNYAYRIRLSCVRSGHNVQVRALIESQDATPPSVRIIKIYRQTHTQNTGDICRQSTL